jgi:hypothetical protein
LIFAANNGGWQWANGGCVQHNISGFLTLGFTEQENSIKS